MSEQVLEIIEFDKMPDVPGLVFRHFRGEADFVEMHKIIMGCREEDGVERSDSVEDIATSYANLSNCDPYKDMVFADVNGETVGYGRCTWWQEDNPPHNRVYAGFGWVLPGWRRRGIGSAMLAYQQDRLREIARDHDDGAPRFFENWAEDGEADKHVLYKRDGYEAITYGASMVRPDLENIPDLPLPEGIQVYPVKEDQLRRIWEADLEAFRDHWGFSEPVDKEKAYSEFLSFPHTDRSLWCIAWDGDPDEGGVVAGQVKSYINEAENTEYNRLRGYTEFISTTREYRRKGIAAALIAMSFRKLKERGMTEASLGVHTENPNGAFDLYKKMGFEVVKLHTTYRKPMD